MRGGRLPEPRITDLNAYPKRWVRLIVAAEWLEIDYRTLCEWLDDGRLTAVPYGKQRRIHIDELRRFHDEHSAA